MKGKPIDIQEAFDAMVKADYRHQEAFLAVSGYLLAKVEAATTNDFYRLAADLESLAKDAGRRESAITGRQAGPNNLLAGLAITMREMAEGPRTMPFGVIEGGKDDDVPPAP